MEREDEPPDGGTGESFDSVVQLALGHGPPWDPPPEAGSEPPLWRATCARADWLVREALLGNYKQTGDVNT